MDACSSVLCLLWENLNRDLSNIITRKRKTGKNAYHVGRKDEFIHWHYKCSSPLLYQALCWATEMSKIVSALGALTARGKIGKIIVG